MQWNHCWYSHYAAQKHLHNNINFMLGFQKCYSTMKKMAEVSVMFYVVDVASMSHSHHSVLRQHTILPNSSKNFAWPVVPTTPKLSCAKHHQMRWNAFKLKFCFFLWNSNFWDSNIFFRDFGDTDIVTHFKGMYSFMQH